MKILIVEDEIHVARQIEKITREILTLPAIALKICATVEEAEAYLRENQIDLLLLDLNLGDAMGFQLLNKMVAKDFHTIIISGYQNKAIEAFEYGVLDFVPKPIAKERLETAFKRFIENKRNPEAAPKYLAVIKNAQISLIDTSDILYIKGASPYSEIHLENGTTELHNKSLDKLNTLLADIFKRVHKSYLVKLSEIKDVRIHQGTKYDLVMQNGVVLPIGRKYYKQIKDFFH